ncbi:MAG: MOSC domain-containing protein [Proteobacteria bacterium]|nr:MOSC domain-containing protein [Pseudomonadota bacterium]
MHLVAVCTGKTRAVEIQGSTVQTAYLKAQVRGPCRIGLAGPEGNETAVHPDTVYAIALEHYDYWTQRLGSHISQSGYGYFAENLTIAGLDEQALHVGDVLLIGSTVRLIVTGPRIPCFKVAWRMQQPQAFVRDFAESGRTGVYFAVLQPGMIEAGDTVEVIHRESANPTVATLGAVARGAVEITTAALARLLALPCLSKTAALLLGGIYYRLLDQPDHTRHWDGWRDFVVLDVKDETDTVKSFELAPADAKPLPRFAAGQYVTLQFADRTGQEFVRPWSLSSYSREPESFRITVKREQHASAALHAAIHKGATVKLRPPNGQFKLDRSRVMPVVLVAAGIGVTPLLSMARAHLDRGPGTAPLRLFHCVRNGAAHPLRTEIAELQSSHTGFKARFYYSQPRPEDAQTPHEAGRLTAERLIAAVADLQIEFAGKMIPVPWYEIDMYLCGPTPFLEQMHADLIQRGARPERLKMEYFMPHARPQRGQSGIPQATVRFARSGTQTSWRQSENSTLLQLGGALGLDLPFSCRSGYCGSCQCRIVEGEVRYEYAPLYDAPPAHALLCCARPASPVLILDA